MEVMNFFEFQIGLTPYFRIVNIGAGVIEYELGRIGGP